MTFSRDDFMDAEEVIQHIMRITNCSRRVAIKRLLKALQGGELAFKFDDEPINAPMHRLGWKQ